MIEAIAVVLGTLWLLLKYGKTKNTRTLFCAFLVVLLQLSQWPFYLPYAISFGSISLMCAGMVIYFNWYKRKDPNAYVYSLAFICFGMIFFAQVYFSQFAKAFYTTGP